MSDIQLPMPSVTIISKVVVSIPAYGEVYSIQHYILKVIKDLNPRASILEASTRTASPPIRLLMHFLHR